MIWKKVPIEKLIGLLVRMASKTKHGPAGSGLDGPCEPDCLKCEIEAMLKEFEG